MALTLRPVVESNTISLQIGGSLELLLRPAPPPEPEIICVVTARFGRFTTTGRGQMAYTMPVDNFLILQVKYVDAHGNDAIVDGEVTWASSDESIATAVVDPADSTLVTVTTVGALGLAQISATADADLGEGVRNIVTPYDITAVAGEAVAGVIAPTGGYQPVPPA